MGKLFDKFGVPIPKQNSLQPVSPSKYSYRFTCVFSNLDIAILVLNVNLKFKKHLAEVEITIKDTIDRNVIHEIVEYSKSSHSLDTITVSLLDPSGKALESTIIRDFKVSDVIISTLDYKSSDPVTVTFTCTGLYKNQ